MMMTSFYKSQKTSTQVTQTLQSDCSLLLGKHSFFPHSGATVLRHSFWDLLLSQAGRTGISEEEQQHRFRWKKCCPMLHWWEVQAAGKAHREEHYQELSSHRQNKKLSTRKTLQRYRQSISLTVKRFAIIQIVTFREKLCDGLLIKFTLKIQDAPLFLCLLLTGRSDKISSQLPSHVCFLTSNHSSRVPGYTAHPTFS